MRDVLKQFAYWRERKESNFSLLGARASRPHGFESKQLRPGGSRSQPQTAQRSVIEDPKSNTVFGRSLKHCAPVFAGLFFTLAVGLSAAEPPPLSPEAASVAAEPPDFLKSESPPSFPVARVVLTLGLLLGALYFVRPLLKKTKWGGAAASGTGLDIVSRVFTGTQSGALSGSSGGTKIFDRCWRRRRSAVSGSRCLFDGKAPHA